MMAGEDIRVHPDCINASNPYHECVEYCFFKIAEAKERKDKKQKVSQQEIVSLYKRFCALDRNGTGFISADEFLSVPEFAVNPLSKRLLRMLDGLNFKDFVYDSDGNGKVTLRDLLEVLQDLTGSFISEEQRQQVVGQVLEEAGYSKDCTLTIDDFVKILGKSGLKMEVEVPVD